MSQLYDIKEETTFTTEMNRTPLYVIGLSNWDQVKFNGTPGVVIDQSLVDKFGYKIGSTITIKEKDFTVTGITKETTGMGMGIIFLDVDKAVPLNDNKVTSISASARGDPETVKKEVESQVSGVTAMTQSDFTKQIDDMMNGIMLFIGAIAV